MNIIWKRPDGGVSVTELVPIEAMLDATEAQKETQKFRIDHPAAHAVELQTRGDIPADWQPVAFDVVPPADRDFRAAWSWTTADPVIDINHDAAIEITQQRLRAERAPLLTALDIKVQRALEDGTDGTVYIEEKRRLRDITILPLSVALGDLDALRALSCVGE